MYKIKGELPPLIFIPHNPTNEYDGHQNRNRFRKLCNAAIFIGWNTPINDQDWVVAR